MVFGKAEPGQVSARSFLLAGRYQWFALRLHFLISRNAQCVVLANLTTFTFLLHARWRAQDTPPPRRWLTDASIRGMFSDSGLIMGWGGTRLNITVGDVREIFNATCTVMMKMAKHLNSESKCVRMSTIESFDAVPAMTIMVVQRCVASDTFLKQLPFQHTRARARLVSVRTHASSIPSMLVDTYASFIVSRFVEGFSSSRSRTTSAPSNALAVDHRAGHCAIRFLILPHPSRPPTDALCECTHPRNAPSFSEQISLSELSAPSVRLPW
jgi:hypothetical protein